jgi:hypothetical protein
MIKLSRSARGFAAVGLAAALVGTVASFSEAAPPPVQRLHPDRGTAGMTYKIGTIYQNSNGDGARIEWYGGAACDFETEGAADYAEVSLSQEDFDNRTSSLNDYASCDTALYQFDNFEGEHTSTASDAYFDAGAGAPYNLSTWNDRASSIKWD